MITLFLAGPARVGKTTAANRIAQAAKKNDMVPVILPFAKLIKTEADKAGYNKDQDPEGYRKFCQEMGESNRAEDPDYWVNLWLQEWKILQDKDAYAAQDLDKIWKEIVVIVDDCRFLNELNLSKKIGATTIFISANGRELPDAGAAWRKHESEHMANSYESGNKDYADIFDWVVKNDTTLTAYNGKLDSRMNIWLGIDPTYMCDCDCTGCVKMKKDEPMSLEDLFRDLLGEDDGA